MNERRPEDRSSAAEYARSAQPPGRLGAQLQADQRRRWHAGERVPVEAYLKQHAALQSDQEAILELIYHEMVLREECGQIPQREDYLQRFPQFAGSIDDLFEVHSALAS